MRKKLLLENANSKVRKVINIVVYLSFIAWLMYSQNKQTDTPPGINNKTVIAR